MTRRLRNGTTCPFGPHLTEVEHRAFHVRAFAARARARRVGILRPMPSRSWRDTAAPIIARVLWETRGADEETRRQALYDAYPFGERRYHPYKVWLDEIARQTGRKPNGRRGLQYVSPGQKERARVLFREAGRDVPAWAEEDA